ncbi:MAG: hypothetical protein AAGH40_02880 [Verrucomicrobiota bacterium]
MKTSVVALFSLCIMQFVAALDLSKPVPEAQDFVGQLDTLIKIEEEELKSCRIISGYSWRNLDLFGNRELTIRADKGDGYMLTYYYQQNPDTGRTELKEKKMSEAEHDSLFATAISLAKLACFEAKEQNSKIFNRWIKIQTVSINDKERNFLIAYWGENEVFAKFRSHLEKWSEPVGMRRRSE